jgi:hypothetical protein
MLETCWGLHIHTIYMRWRYNYDYEHEVSEQIKRDRKKSKEIHDKFNKEEDQGSLIMQK